MDIMEIDPVDFGAAVAHMAASQLFGVLAGEEHGDDRDGRNWYGAPDDRDDAERDVLELAAYVAKTRCYGEQLFNKARIDRILAEAPENNLFRHATLPRQWAYNLFAAVSLQCHDVLIAQQRLQRHRLEEAAAKNPQMALEDSIFEPIDGLGDEHAHATRFLADDAASAPIRAAQQLLEEVKAGKKPMPDQALQDSIRIAENILKDAGIPSPLAQIDPPQGETPAPMSIGTAAEQPQGSSGTPGEPEGGGQVPENTGGPQTQPKAAKPPSKSKRRAKR